MRSTNLAWEDSIGDDQLIRRIKTGDETALDVLMKKYSTRVYGAAFRVLRRQPDAQEVTQDVFWALWRSPDRFDMARGQLLTWLVILSRSRALDLLRRIQANMFRQNELTVEILNTSPALIQNLTPAPGVLIEELLQRLPSEQGCVVQMVYIEGYALREVASLLHAPLGTIKGRTRLALQKLRSELRSYRKIAPVAVSQKRPQLRT
jgi:RNA polymerase sigma-70 factor (ECF subfamily)